MMIRYESMRVDKALAGAYAARLQEVLKVVQGNDDVERLLSGWQERFASYIGTRFSLALNSGSDALQIALMASKIKPGDEVIVPNITYPAVALAVCYLKAIPVLVEVSEKDLNIDVRQVGSAITKKTKAIIAVHMFSQACDIDGISAIGSKYDLTVIEDVCQAESSMYKGKKLGSWADIGCFSFSYYKPLSSCGGGGGMLTFNDPRYNECVRYTQVWRDDPALASIQHRFPRMYLMDLIAVETKFRYLSKIIESRQRIQRHYEHGLQGLADVMVLSSLPERTSVLQNFTVFVKDRDGLDAFLQKHDVFSMRPYAPLNRLAAFFKYAGGREYRVSDYYAKNALHLPLFSFMKEEECEYICELIRKYYAKKRRRKA